MKKYIFAIIFISTLNLFSMEYDLDVITLPYDSLNIEEIVVSNFTILARSGNTIYKSTDDGENWKIAFESELKINQLYSKDPHTILLVGEKGMVYRTMDYGETWLDESVDTDSTLIKVAARNYQDYVALAETRWLYHKFSLDKDWLAFNSQAAVYISTLVAVDNLYYYAGGTFGTTTKDRGVTYYESTTPGYKYNENGLYKFDIISMKSEKDNYPNKFILDSVRFFSVKDSLIIVALNENNSVVSKERYFFLDYGRHYGIEKDVISGIIGFNDTMYIVSRTGNLERVLKESLNYDGKRIDVYDLNIDLVNQIKNPYGKVIYIASNNSRIYKINIYEPVSSIQVETNNLIKQYNDALWIDDEVENIRVFNYLGQNQLLNYQSENRIILKKGIYFISYFYKNNYLTSKILVN